MNDSSFTANRDEWRSEPDPESDKLPVRILADLGPREGPLLLVTYQIHGNEPAGRFALERFLHWFGFRDAPPLAGRLVAICGNRHAAAVETRECDYDLNRVFPTELAGKNWKVPGRPGSVEHGERDELIALVHRLEREHEDAPRWFLDLHTTSSESMPYLSLPGDADDLLAFAERLPMHHVSGFSDIVPGTIDRYLYEHGFVGAVCEGGHHARRSSVSNMEALLWLTLDQTGILRRPSGGTPSTEVAASHDMLHRFLIREASHFRLIYRHGIDPADCFQMEHGFSNFSKVHEGQILAYDHSGPIHSHLDAHLLMPLYQASGTDGFFLVKEQD